MKALDVYPDFAPRTLELGSIPYCQYQRGLTDELADGMTDEDAVFGLRVMHSIRAFETMVARLRSGQLVPHEGYRFVGTTHLSVGQEAVAVGACAALGVDDYITSTHRGHGHGIAKGAYALRAGSPEQLEGFCSQVDLAGDTDAPFDRAMDVHLYRTMAEFLGKEAGYCRGRGGGMHIADFNVGHLGANAIVAGSVAVATGAGMSMMLQDSDRVALCFHGDGAVNNGIWAESLNMACGAQFREKGVRVIYAIENNQYAISGQARGELTGVEFLAKRGFAYAENGMHAEVVNGMDVLAVRDAVRRAMAGHRRHEGPVLLEMLTYRFLGHMLGDQERYRSKQEVAAWKAQDPIARLEAQLIQAGKLTQDRADAMRERIYENMESLTCQAARSADPDPATLHEGLFSDTDSSDVPRELQTVDYDASVIGDPRRGDSQGTLAYRQAVREALIEEMVRDKRVVFYGEDVAEHGGAFAVTPGLYEIFGKQRVFNAPISESAICGTALGMALTGLRPVAELMYIDFILQSMDQVGNQVAKNKFMFGGKATVPWTLRTTTGGGRGYAGQHSQSLEAIPAHIPGLKVVAPATPADAKGLLKTAIREDNPVIVIEHLLLYADKGPVPQGDYLVPIGQAAVTRSGRDVTIVAYSYMAKVALEAAEMLAAEGIDAEVIDLRSLVPMDTDTVTASVRKTGRAVVVSQAWQCCSFAEHIVWEIVSRCFDRLQSPVGVVAAPAVPSPMSPTLERAYMPDAEKTCAEVRRTLKR